MIALVSGGVAACGQTLAAAPDDPVDAGAAGDGSAADATCSTTIRDDFDRDDPVSADWVPTVDRGAITSSMGAFSSATENTGALLDKRVAVLTRDLSAVPKSLKCSFNMRIDTPPNSSNVDAFSVLLTGPDGNVSRIRLRVQHTSIGLREDLFLADGGCVCPKGIERNSTADIKTADWTTVTFSTDDYKKFSATAGDVPVAFTLPEAIVPTKVSLVLGTINFTDGEPATQTFDAFVCDLGC